MKTWSPITVLLLLLAGISQSLFSQSHWELSSEVIPLDIDTSHHHQFVRLDDGIGVFEEETQTLYELGLDGRMKRMVVQFDSSSVPAVSRKNIIATKDAYFVTGYKNRILKIDKDGKSSSWLEPKLKREGISYFIVYGDLASFTNFYSPERNSLFLRVHPQWKFSKKADKRYRYGIEHYETPGLIVEISVDGELKNFFGEYDDIYRQKHFLYYLDACTFDQYKDVGLVYTLQLTNKLFIESFDGGGKVVFGEKGRFMKKEFNELPEIKDPVEGNLEKTSNILEAPFNWGVYSGGRFILRIYTTGIEDTVTVSRSEMEYLEKLKNGEVEGCALAPLSELRRLKLLSSKPFFVQVYDTEDDFKLILDEPIDLRYPTYLGYHGGKFYFSKGGKPLKVMAVSITKAHQPGG